MTKFQLPTLLKPFPLDWCLQYDWKWLNKSCYIFSQALLRLLNSMSYSFLVSFVLVSTCFEMVMMVTCTWGVMRSMKPLRLSICTNFLSQWLQFNGFSSVPILSHTLRLSFIWLEILGTVVAVEWFSSAYSCSNFEQRFHQMTDRLNWITSLLNVAQLQTEWVIWIVNVCMSVNNELSLKGEQQNVIEIRDFCLLNSVTK